ncbi:MAG: CidA/LrgA family protein [Tissierellaceae bacterium]|jgi:holin-like protein|nr:CidA/LrgA family protein [Tissierellia bacterium]
MKYIGQIGLLMLVTFLGELFNKVLPWPVPGSIYGFILMLLSLQLKIIRLEMIKDVADFLLDIMPVMFIPAAVGLLVIWEDVSQYMGQILLICITTTLIVMVTTGKVTDLILGKAGDDNDRSDY